LLERFTSVAGLNIDGIGGTIQSAEQHVEFGCCDADCIIWGMCFGRFCRPRGFEHHTTVDPASGMWSEVAPMSQARV
jgi:hypothetical protein